jgi:hypothetical protein
MASRRTAHSHKMHLFCRLLLFSLITTGGTYAMSIPFSTIEKDCHSGIKEPIRQVIRTAEEFGSFWAKHGSDSSPPSTRESPAIDFSTSMVVLVYVGSKKSSGYSVHITGVQDSGSSIVISYKENEPGPDDVVFLAFTEPYHIIKTDKSSKTVVFYKRTNDFGAMVIWRPYYRPPYHMLAFSACAAFLAFTSLIRRNRAKTFIYQPRHQS